MTVRLKLETLPLEHVGFGYSVLSELMLSLHVLNNPKQHPLHISWTLQTNRRLSAELRTQYRWLRPIITTAAALLLVPDNADEPQFEREFATLTALSPTYFAELMLADFIIEGPPIGRRIRATQPAFAEFQQSPALRQQAETWLTRYYPESDGLLDQLLASPATVQARFLQLIQAYWDAVFREEWARLEPIFLQEIMARGRFLMRDGVVAMAKNMSGRFSADSTQQTLIYVKPGAVDEMTPDYLNFYPSYFTYPSLIFSFRDHADHNTLTAAVTYPMPQQQYAGQPPVPSEQLSTILRAAADHTRLQILQLVAEKPRSTSELAQIIRLSNAAISKQLKQLQRAGWVTAHRDSYYVLYSASREPLDQLTTSLGLMLDGLPTK